MVDFLSALNDSSAWRELYGSKSPRLRDQELILRIIALYTSSDDYFRLQKKFLNEFLGKHRNLQMLNKSRIGDLFNSSARALLVASGRSALRRYRTGQVNAALTEALFVGLMRRLNAGRPISIDETERSLAGLATDQELTNSISGSTATEEYVRKRISVATEYFETA
jgi:hypothetical protein